jgi:hypothetical protein
MPTKRNRQPLSNLFLFATISIVSVNAHSQSCETYPYQPLENTIEFEGGGRFKILSTASATVDFDDNSEIMSARRQAELLAKRAIAEYINQNLQSEDSINSEIEKSKTNLRTQDGEAVSSARRNETKRQLSTIRTRADAVLKGAVSIGSCYTKGREVRVTVGIKSETVNNAMNLEKLMGADRSSTYGKPPTPKKSSNSEIDVPATSGGYDGSRQLKKF